MIDPSSDGDSWRWDVGIVQGIGGSGRRGRLSVRVVAVSLVASLAIGVIGTPHAGAGQGKARPFVQCVFWNEAGPQYAVFGYESRYDTDFNIAEGSDNFFFPSPSSRGQPTLIKKGMHRNVVTVVLTGEKAIGWFLDDNLAIAENAADAPTCEGGPQITGVAPAGLAIGRSGQTLAVFGSGFPSEAANPVEPTKAVITGDDIAFTAKKVSARRIDVTVDVFEDALPGRRDLTVTYNKQVIASCVACVGVGPDFGDATGPTGPTGPQGPAGPEGPAGKDATLGYRRVSSKPLVARTSDVRSGVATCPPGKVVIGGGYRIANGRPARAVIANWPSSDRQWKVTIETFDGNTRWNVWAICAVAS